MSSANRVQPLLPSGLAEKPRQLSIRRGDLSLAGDQAAVLELLNLYASRLAGRMQPLDDSVESSLD